MTDTPVWAMVNKPGKTGPSGNPVDLDPIDDVVLESLPGPDRLPPMLFLATLIHGVLIIGITFNTVLVDDFHKAISLEVTIVTDPDPNVLDTKDAEYLSQVSQLGSGNTQEQARVESYVRVDNEENLDGNSPTNSNELKTFVTQLLTARENEDSDVTDKRRDVPFPDISRAAQLQSGIELTMPLPQDSVSETSIHDNNPRELVTSANTKESKIAGYLSRWKTKIEWVGIKHFPNNIIVDEIVGSPTLEVAITASGQLDDVLVRRSSGSNVLDEVALSILQKAAPFDPFPEAIRINYDRLRFAYKWQFDHLHVQTIARTD